MPAERVIDAALDLIDQQGVADFSMRTLAKRLGSSTATIYRHFSSKDEIFVHVVDRVLGEVAANVPEVPAESHWQERLIAMASGLYATLKDHPNVVPLFDTHVPLGPHALAAREGAISILFDSGIPPEKAARAFTAVARFAVGFASQLRVTGAATTEEDDEVRQFYLSLDPQKYPATVASAPYLPISLDDEFHFGLRLFIKGLAEHLMTEEGGVDLTAEEGDLVATSTASGQAVLGSDRFVE